MSFISKIDRSQRAKVTNEIFTPTELVEEMLDQVPNEFWSDPSKKILEPSFGNGSFLVAIVERLMTGLADVFPDSNVRFTHIMEKMIFGVEIMPDNVEETIERLGCGHLKHNLICADALTYSYKFDEHEPKEEDLFIWPE